LAKVFWFIGRSGSGKTTLTKKLESHLKDKTKILIIEDVKPRSEIKSNFGILSRWYFRLQKKKMRKLIFKSIFEQANKSFQSDVTVLIPIAASQKKIEHAKEQFNGSFIEIYLKCSMECGFKRYYQRKRINTKSNLTVIKNYQKFFEEPKSPDLTINTEFESVEDSFQTILTFIEK